MTVIVRSVHNNILPHIFECKLQFRRDIVDDSFLPKNRKPKPISEPAAEPAQAIPKGQACN